MIPVYVVTSGFLIAPMSDEWSLLAGDTNFFKKLKPP